MYQTSDWSIMLRAIMDISARTNSLPERPQRTIWVTSVRMRREDRTSVSSHPLADLGRWIIRFTQERLRGLKLTCFEAATTSKHAPGDARELVGKCNRKDIAV